MSARAWAACTIVWLVPAAATAMDVVGASPDPQPIYGGTIAPTCAWPAAVGLYGDAMQCTGVLVHPELVLTAGHCLEEGALTTVTLGEDVYAPVSEIGIVECVRHPDYEVDYPDYADFAACRLAQPIEDVPPVPILMGCEVDALVPGVPVVFVGYGVANDGSQDGPKRSVTVPLEIVDGLYAFAGAGGMGTCNGDSGGPAYVQLADGSWRVFGTTTGGEVCGESSQSQLVHPLVPWIEDAMALDVTPCHTSDGTWAPTEACGGFPMQPDTSQATWASACVGGPVSAPSETCGSAFGESDETTSTGADTDEGGDASGSGEASTGDDDGDTGDDGTPPPGTFTTTAGFDDTRGDTGCACTTSSDRGSLAAAVALIVLAAGRRRRQRSGWGPSAPCSLRPQHDASPRARAAQE